MKIILKVSYILSLLFVSCFYSNEYLGNSPDYENRLVCADTSNRILSIYYPAISRVDSNINANTTRLLLPTDATTSIIVILEERAICGNIITM